MDNAEGTENGALLTVGTSNPVKPSSNVVLSADQIPSNNITYKFLSSFQCPSSQYPIGDMRLNESAVAQCRVPCENFDFSPYEALRIATGCQFATLPEADSWFSNGPNGNPQVCIPREQCFGKCGEQGYGCVHSGTCISRFCFSDMDSQQPAIFTNLSDDGSISEVFVNNSGPVVDADPPYYKFEDSLDGSATTVPPKGLFSAANKPRTSDAMPTPSMSSLPPPSIEDNQPEQNMSK